MNYVEAEEKILRREKFTKSNQLSGRVVPNKHYLDVGLLTEDRDRFIELRDANRLSYVVYSYATPIAWYDIEHGWFVTDEYFSHVTSRAQNIVRRISYSN